MKRWRWTPEMVEAACVLARRYGAKGAAAMLGLSPGAFHRQMSRLGVSLVALKREPRA